MKQIHPLQGIRVVDLSWIVAGPQCTSILADFGAEVIRIENEQNLDYCRSIPPVLSEESPNTSGLFNELNRNKLSVTLNVLHPQGLELLQDLIAISDVVVENFSSRVLERWGLDYVSQKHIKPDIIYLSMSGFGHTGRDRDHVTWGPTAQALSGLTYMSGLPHREPAGWGFSYMDHTAGHYGAMAVMMAIHHRNRTGEGQWVDLSQVEVGMTLTGPSVLDYTVNSAPYRHKGNPPGNRAPERNLAPYNSYRCKGKDRWCVITVCTEEQWCSLMNVMGKPDWMNNPKFRNMASRVINQYELDDYIRSWTKDRCAHHIMKSLQAVGVPSGVVQTPKERVDEDPQLRERTSLVSIKHRELGLTGITSMPVKLSKSPWALRSAAPLLGEHCEQIYRGLLGLSADALKGLAEENII